MQGVLLQLMAAATQKQPGPTAHPAQCYERMQAHKAFISYTSSPAIHSCELELAAILAEAHPFDFAILYCTNEF